MMNGVGRLQQARFEGFMDSQDKMSDAMDRAESQHQRAIDEGYAEAMKEIEANQEARKKKSIFTLLGTLFLGPLIGTAIGNAVGEAVNEGDQKEAEAAKRKVNEADRQVEDSWDTFKDTKEDLDSVMDQAEQIRKVSQELDQLGWIGTDK